jgi:hypothetical protein
MRITRRVGKLVLLLWWLVGCGSVSEVPADGGGGAPVDAAGAGGAAGGQSGSGGAPGAAGASLGGRGGGAAGTVATAGATGTGGGGAAGTAGGVSAVACPADWTVQRGCAGQNVQGAPCDVCHDGAGAPLRCATSAVATARVFCVPDCASCY